MAIDIRPCRTSERDVGAPLISLIALAGQRSTLRRLEQPHYQAVAERGAGIGVFPSDGPLHHLEIGI